jgi:nuclear transcription factor Y gamma
MNEQEYRTQQMDDRIVYNQEGIAEEQGALAEQGIPLGESDTFSNVAQGLTGHHRDIMMQYWQDTINSIEHDDHKFKIHQLPLARIKKVMKADEDVKMISAEAPILFAKGCDIFITELTMRAWIHAEENKRRTLQRSDIASALQKSDMFDFLIDIVPREDALGRSRPPAHQQQQQQGPHQMSQYHDQQYQQGEPSDYHGPPGPGGQIPPQTIVHHHPPQTGPGALSPAEEQDTVRAASRGPAQQDYEMEPHDLPASRPQGQDPYGQVYPQHYGDHLEYNGYRQY